MAKRFLALVLAMMLAAAPALAAGVTWSISEDGVLTLSGEGALDGTTIMEIPYEELMRVTDVVIEEGITEIGAYALEMLETTVKTVALPESLTTVGAYILGNKGALGYTFYGAGEEIRRQMEENSEDYIYCCRFEEMPQDDALDGAKESADLGLVGE